MTLSKTQGGRGQRRRSPNRVVKLVTVAPRRSSPGKPCSISRWPGRHATKDLVQIVNIQAD